MSELARSYKRDPVRGDFDVIVVGSGMGGMSTAAFLAREGRRVLVLERHYTPGGFTHVFTRKGYEWDVGVHYVGEVHREHSEMSRVFRYITDGTLKWAGMGEVYDRMFFGEAQYDFPGGVGAFKERMKSYFPAREDQQSIDAYVDLIYRAQRTHRLFFAEKTLPPVLSRIAGGLLRRSGLHGNKSTLTAMREITNNQRLIAVLTGQFGDYGLPPSRSSFMIHAMLVKHFMNGGNYPVGGASQIFQSIAPTVRKAGGEIFIGAEVSEILVRDRTAIGVRMADGKEIHARTIVSDAGAYNTYQLLLPAEERARLGTDALFKSLTPSVGHLCLYVGIDQPNAELKLGKANYWIFPDHYDHDANIERYIADPDAELPLVYISFPSSKDPDWERRHPGRTTLEIITLAPYEWYRHWEDARWMRRGGDYDDRKEEMSQRLLGALYKRHPELRGKIDHYELSTPLSTRHFANYRFGELYGVDHDTARYAQRFLRPHTPVKHLYLTGQDIVSCGVGGALLSGMLTAMAITRRNLAGRIQA